jgi:nickel-type superoxide dismutase maturation protease
MAALTTIQIIGPSMEPWLRNNDVWVAKQGKAAKPGQVIVFREPGRPELLVVKRIDRATANGWWVVADNPLGAVDSNQFGAVPFDSVVARLLFRIRPLFRRS